MKGKDGAIILLSLAIFLIGIPFQTYSQLQFGIGMSTGLSRPVIKSNSPDSKGGADFSLTPEIFLNYVMKGTYGFMFKIAYPNYGYHYQSLNPFDGTSKWYERTYSNLEFELSASYKHPINKKTAYKFSVGGSASALAADFTGQTYELPDGTYFTQIHYERNNNIYAIAKAGLQWIAPGKNVYIYIGLDYHFGLKQEYFQQTPYTYSGNYYTDQIHGRGSYLALDFNVIFGKEKKKLHHVNKAREPHFVM